MVGGVDDDRTAGVLVDFRELFAHLSTAYLVMSADLVIVEANGAYLRLLQRTRAELVGRPVFEAFPPEPGALDADGRNPLQVSFERVRDTGVADVMPLLEYGVRDAEGGEVEQRFWSLVHSAVLGVDGRPALVLQRVEDVTQYAREREQERSRGSDWRRRAELVEADLYVRAQELRAALQAQEVASRRLAGLADAALQLAAAETVQELVEKVVAAGLIALGADGGAIAVRDDPRGLVQLTITDSLGARTQQQYAQLPLDGDLPSSWAARTGELVVLPDRQAGMAWSPAMAGVYEATGRQAWVALPLRAGERLLGSLTASWAQPHPFVADELDLLSAFAAQCAQALARLQVREVEQQAAAAARQMSEALQRSLLTDPPQHDHLQVVVRYRAAAEQVQVGGDWYDAFLNSGGAMCLVVGDVTGHDREAAAVMGQVRNLLRALAHTLGEPPGRVLSAVDRAMSGLQVRALATAVLARVEQTEQQRAAGLRLLRWSNAGHPPPLLLEPDGTARLLTGEPDLLLGLDPATGRGDHSQVLAPGATVLLFTDGLIERRGASIDDGLAWLLAATRGRQSQDLDALCDYLLDEVAGSAEDDVALLALRAHPEDRPRSAAAGSADDHDNDAQAGLAQGG